MMGLDAKKLLVTFAFQCLAAIDAGSIFTAPKIDIRGVQRPQGVGIDVGPYEFQDVQVPLNSGIR